MRKIISIVLSFGLLFQQSGLLYAAGEINLANYLSQAKSAMIQPDIFQPARLRYISYDIAGNDFKILLDKGDSFNQKTEKPKNLKTLESLNSLTPKLLNSKTPELNESTQELFNYFLIGLALPNDTFWVNLRPDAPENIIDPLLEKTDIGKIFLEADLQLKKDTASLTSPQNPEGKAYWDKLYKKAGELFGTENITIPTITRPWIVPNEVIVRETEDSAYIYKATLKVMLEADYLQNQKTEKLKKPALPAGRQKTDEYGFSDPRLKELNEYSSRIIRETIIPKLTREVNSSKRYAKLRQVYYSLVLARWFKQKYSSLGSIRAPEPQSTSSLANSYISLIDSGNLANLVSKESCDKQVYFQAYQKSFKDGEYNLKETVATPFGQSIRSYISGGISVKYEKEGFTTLPNKEVINALTGQLPPATTASPLTVEGFAYMIKELSGSKDPIIDKIKKIIKFGITIKGEESEKSLPSETIKNIDNMLKIADFIEDVPVFLREDLTLYSISDTLIAIQTALEESKEQLRGSLNKLKYKIMLHFDILEEKGQDEIQSVFDGTIKEKDVDSGWNAIARFIDDLNKQQGGNMFSYDKNLIVDNLEKTMQINTLLPLFERYNQQQKSLEDTIKDQAAIVVGSDNRNNIRFGGLRDREKVKIGVERILAKILEVSQDKDKAISYKSLKLAQQVFIIASQEDKTYPYRQIIGSRIMPVFAKFLEKKYSVFEVKDIQVKIRTALSNYIQRDVFDFLRAFIKQNRDNPYGKFIGAEGILDALSVELEQKTQEEILGEIDYDIKALSLIIKQLRGLSEDAKLKTVEEAVSLIKIVTAGSPLTLEQEVDALIRSLPNELYEGLSKNKELSLLEKVKRARENFAEKHREYSDKAGVLFNSQVDRETDKLSAPGGGFGMFVSERTSNYLRASDSRYAYKTLRDKADYLVEKLTYEEKKTGSAGSPLTGVSSVIGAQKDVLDPKRGGIDLTDRMLNMQIERVGSFASSALVLPEITNVEALDLDKEYERIQAMVSSSIRPSDTRILEFAAACYYRGEFDQRLAQVSSCIKAAHLADEISGRDSSEALRLATMLPDALYGG